MRPAPWSAAEDAILRGAYEDDAIENPLGVAMPNLPGRSRGSAGVRACLQGWSGARQQRREAAGLSTRSKQQKEPRVPRAQKPAEPRAVAPKLPPIRLGPCDRGDRETIRRRVIFAIDKLAGELRRAPSAVADAVREIANDQYREQSPLGRVPIDDIPSVSLVAHGHAAPRAASATRTA